MAKSSKRWYAVAQESGGAVMTKAERPPSGYAFEEAPSPWVRVWFVRTGAPVDALKAATGARGRRYVADPPTWLVHQDKWPAVLAALRELGYWTGPEHSTARSSHLAAPQEDTAAQLAQLAGEVRRLQVENRRLTQLLAASQRCDAWSALFLTPGAPPELVEAAYRRLALLYHPDRGGPGASAARMQAVNLAYEQLAPRLRDGTRR